MKTTKWMMLVALVAPAAARAGAEETADEAFARGQSALKSGRVHQACEAFEASEKLEAKVDTEGSLAVCYEQDGKPVAAAKLYRGIVDKDPIDKEILIHDGANAIDFDVKGDADKGPSKDKFGTSRGSQR